LKLARYGAGIRYGSSGQPSFSAKTFWLSN
jgi:hypothetical protein